MPYTANAASRAEHHTIMERVRADDAERIASIRRDHTAMDAEHAAWLDSAEPDLLKELMAKRATARDAELRAELNRISEMSDDEADELADEIEWQQVERAAEMSEPALVYPSPAPTGPIAGAVSFDDFIAYLPMHSYIFKPTREMWPAASINSRLPPVIIPMREKPISATQWLDTNQACEQITWAPALPMEIKDRLIADGEWILRPGCTTFNTYRPAAMQPQPGDPTPWIEHVRRVFGDNADHLVKWLAHRVQRPHEKINHAIVLGGAQGIGKDTLLEPIKHAVGAWNFAEVTPKQMLGRFNGFVKSVVLRISEARDLGEVDRYGFYEAMKVYTAAPPDVLRCDEKHLREHNVFNVCGVVMTTNHKTGGVYLPSDDRRHFVAWSPLTKDDFTASYWTALWRWFANGGNEIVAHYLGTLDLSDFDAKAPPRKTQAWWDIVDASRAPEDAELADALDKLGRPAATTVGHVVTKVLPEFSEWLRDRKNRGKIPHRFEACDYVAVRNPDAKDGLWVINGKRQVVYARRETCLRDQLAAAAAL